MRIFLALIATVGLGLTGTAPPADAGMADAQAFLDHEIAGLSVLPRAKQEAEMQWFIDAARPYQGMRIRVASEGGATHRYEAEVLAQAFYEITGISVVHDAIPEPQVVETFHRQMQSGDNLYDIYVVDSDLLGGHWRYQQVRTITDWMAGDGAQVTSPTLDLGDFAGVRFTTAPDGKLYQLPSHQSAGLYWFRFDWFQDDKNRRDFRAAYGYNLDVPENWAAYEDIAAFFTGRDLGHMGVSGPVFGHMDYGAKTPELSERFTDAWLGLAGVGDRGMPNGFPVNDWGIRVNESGQPVGSCVNRGGATNGPAAVYAMDRYATWLRDFAPPGAARMTYDQAAVVPLTSNVAQQIVWYAPSAAQLGDATKEATDKHGAPTWRIAPPPKGAYWKPGMKTGYQDIGAWTLMKSTPTDRARAAWLYAQFVSSKTVDLKRSHEGLTFIRKSTVAHKSFDARAPELGGVVEFYRSSEWGHWAPAGTNVPDYPALAPIWAETLGDVAAGLRTPKQALDALCAGQEKVLRLLERTGVQGRSGPQLNQRSDPAVWLALPGAPVPKLADEDPTPRTVSYDAVLRSW